MSYILDALRRADAERQRGQVPGIGATVAAPRAGPRAPLPLWTRPAFWLALALVVTLAGLALLLVRQKGPDVRQAAAPSQVPPMASAPLVAAPTPALPVVVSAPVAAPQPLPATETQRAPSGPSLASPVSPAPPGPAPRPLRLGELTAEQRQGLPPLVVGGSVWSDTAANRLLILDGQMLREGQAVAAGLVLLRIQPKSAVLRWRGIEFELPV